MMKKAISIGLYPVKMNAQDREFKVNMMALGEAVKNIILKNDVNALKGIQTLSSFMALNPSLNNGSGVISYVIRETMKKYDSNNPMPIIAGRKVLDAFPGFSEDKVKEVLEGFENLGFIGYIINPMVAPQFQKEIPYLSIKLTPLWNKYLKEYKRKSKENELFIESIGRIIWASILIKNGGGGGAGFRTFRILILILTSATNGELSIQEAERLCYQIGEGKFSQLISCDNAKDKEIRFFTYNDGEKFKINPNTLKAYVKYVVPLTIQIKTTLNYPI